MLGLMQEWPLLCHKLIDNRHNPAIVGVKFR